MERKFHVLSVVVSAFDVNFIAHHGLVRCQRQKLYPQGVPMIFFVSDPMKGSHVFLLNCDVMITYGCKIDH